MKREKKVVAIVKFWPQWLVLEDVKKLHKQKQNKNTETKKKT